MTLRVGGLASGLDTNLLVNQLLKLERRPVQIIESRLKQVQERQQVWRAIGQRLGEIADIVATLQSKTAWTSLQASSSDSSVVTASLGNQAVAGSWQVEVHQQAQPRIVASNHVSVVGPGSFFINGVSVTLAEATDLKGLVAAINSAGQARAEVAAVNVSGAGSIDLLSKNYSGSEAGLYKFVARGSDVEVWQGDELVTTRADVLVDGTGVLEEAGIKIAFTDVEDGDYISLELIPHQNTKVTASAVDGRLLLVGDDHNTIEFSDPDGLLQAIGLIDENGEPLNVLQQGNRSQFSVNGLLLERDTNIIDDVVEGIVLNLKGSSSSPITVTVERDTADLVATVKELVEKYNSLQSYIRTQTGANGLLSGDHMATRLANNLRLQITHPIDSGKWQLAAQVGVVSADRNGTLEFDEAKLRAALLEDFEAVHALFAGPDGLGKRLESALTQWSASRGLIKGRIDSYSSSIRRFNRDIERAEARIAIREQQLWRQFTALETALSTLHNQSEWLAGQINNLPGFTRPQPR